MYLQKKHNQDLLENTPGAADEYERQAKLEEYNIVDTLPENEFDSLVELAAMITGTPVSLMNLLVNDRQWSKATYGTDMQSMPRSGSICQYTILGESNFEVEDLTEDNRFLHMPYVQEEPKFRYYHGYPLRTSDGYNIGALCVLDTEPKKLTKDQERGLQTIAEEIMARLELRKKQKQLQELNREKDQLLHAVNHDIKSPLNGIVSSANYLMNVWEGDKKELDQILSMIDLSGRKLINYTSELVTNAMKQGESKLILDEVEIRDLVKDLIDIYKPLASAKGVNISTHFSTPGTFQLDREKFKLIISNLMSNALKFCREGDNITLDMKVSGTEDKELHIHLSDTGIGIPAEFIPSIFKNKNKHQRQGTQGEISTGLGLPIIKKYVDLHEGNIRVESIEGMGTSFHITIPENMPG